ncbi:GNAT family N-acetyltransferase [Kiloniella sp.]|uniref:GNAT family N-acetyltransferase n=1 Tax=Kiloniella sp. TaxID=1938587 RepID=UPI003B01D68A
MEVKTDLLENHPEFIEACAHWNYNAWSKNSGWTLKQTISGYRDLASNNKLEQGFVALSEGKLLGTALLIENDHESYKHYRPWLAALYVDPNHRGQRIARNLVNTVKDFARKRGEARLFLYTKTPKIYKAMGWNLVEVFMENNTQYSLMDTNLIKPSA